VPAAANDAPHAPWWHVDPATGRSAAEGTWAVPSAEIVGYLWTYRRFVPTPVLDRLTEKALAELRTAPARLDLHDFLAWQRLAGALTGCHREAVLRRLSASLRKTLEAPDAWGRCGAEPIAIAPAPDAPFYDPLADLVTANLDARIRTRDPVGGWWPNRRWAAYPEAWEEARRAWAGFLTVRLLKTFRDFGRL